MTISSVLPGAVGGGSHPLVGRVTEGEVTAGGLGVADAGAAVLVVAA